MDALTRGIEKAGGLTAFANALTKIGGKKITPQTVNMWRTRGKVSLKAVWTVSAYTGVPVWEIRPDVFDTPEKYIEKAITIRSAEAV